MIIISLVPSILMALLETGVRTGLLMAGWQKRSFEERKKNRFEFISTTTNKN